MNEQIAKIVGSKWFNPALFTTGGLLVGGGLGYILGRRHGQASVMILEHTRPEEDLSPAMDLSVDQLEKLREAINREEELEAAREELAERPTRLVLDEEKVLGHPTPENGNADDDETPSVEVQERIEAFNRDAEAAIAPPIEETVIAQSVFAGSDDEWDYQKELASRSSERPYIIHKDEFYSEESGYTQTTLTYYSGDDIMADENDSPVYNYQTVTGPLHFGHGSQDPNVVYVRNDKRMAEYEILFDHGMFVVEVMGMEDEQSTRARDLKHSAPKFRMTE